MNRTAGTAEVRRIGAAPTRRWLRGAAVTAPVALIAGWILGAVAQPGHFSSLYSTISDLAATNAHHRLIMTAGLSITGVCLLVVSAASTAASTAASQAGRIAVGVAGAAVLVVAGTPLPHHGQLHGAAAFVAFTCLTFWPLLGFRVGATPAARVFTAVLVTTVNLIFLLWLELVPGTAGGFAERVLSTVTLAWVALQAFTETSRR